MSSAQPQHRNNEYLYFSHLTQRSREVISHWRKSGELIPYRSMMGRLSGYWTYKEAKSFTQELSDMFREYNRVLWHDFPYCRQCGGGCCHGFQPSGSLLDALVLTLLEVETPPLPSLSPQDGSDKKSCFYLTENGCSWPEVWRPLDCLTYFCLGQPNPYTQHNRREKLEPIVQKLFHVFMDLTPRLIQREGSIDANILRDWYLIDPLDLTEALRDVLYDLFVFPINDYFNIEDPEDGMYLIIGQKAKQGNKTLNGAIVTREGIKYRVIHKDNTLNVEMIEIPPAITELEIRLPDNRLVVVERANVDGQEIWQGYIKPA